MKKLILLQGASGTGKSSWIRDHHVQCYTISADEIRQRLGLAVHTRRGNMPIIKIKNHDDTITWDIFNKIIDYRITQTDLTIVDNTNTSAIALNQMHNLAAKYNCQVYLLDFMRQFELTNHKFDNTAVQRAQGILLKRNSKRIMYPVPKYVLINQIGQYRAFRSDMDQNPDKYNWLEWLDVCNLTDNDIEQLINN